uniref:AAA family ATPase n=1 Tax=uncultured Allobacillus sp. TaxID=1638025 RepID=UPI002593E338|nr:AAA family ATPase [uncultured Allobacillus sp.]
MKKLILLSLSLHNFKGIQDFYLDTSGESIRVFGDNATGKTTVFDGFVWLLFDKDSNNKKDFQIKTVSEDGKELHNLNHEVEATFLLNGQELTLKKVYTEKWTKKRGSASKEFTGHTTDYYIDGVPSKKKEYTEKVAEIIDEDVFKLLTSPSYFNEQLHWKDRRQTLLEVAGDVSNDEVIESNNELDKLKEILTNRSIDDHKKVITSKQKEINKRLDVIPELIAEVQRGMVEVNPLKKDSLDKEIASIQNIITEKQDKINNLKNGSEINNLKKQLSDIELELSNIKNEHDRQGQDELFKLKTRLQEEESNKSILTSKINNSKQLIESNQQRIQEFESQTKKLRDEWKEINVQEFTHEEDCNCPACGQELPEEQIQSAREKAQNQFNQEKASKLETIGAEGKRLNQRIDELEKQNESHQEDIRKAEAEIAGKDRLIDKLKGQIKELESKKTDITENTAYKVKIKEKEDIQSKIDELQGSTQESVQKLENELSKHKEEQHALQVQLSEIEASERSQKRIEELEEEEKKLANEYEKLAEELHLTEEFIRTKVNMLESKINSKFERATFKLFKENINGGLEETCETLFKGVPYSSGLNNAAKINVGLDIINTLSDHYGFNAPIFIDNAEAVTKLIDTKAQTISLVVSEKDKQLRIEKPEQEQREAV